MKVVVRKKFTDKYTGETYEAGSMLDIRPERYEEIRETDADLVIAVADDTGTEEGKTEPVAAGQSAADDAGTEEGKTEPVAAGQSAADDAGTEESKKEPKKRAKKSDE